MIGQKQYSPGSEVNDECAETLYLQLANASAHKGVCNCKLASFGNSVTTRHGPVFGGCYNRNWMQGQQCNFCAELCMTFVHVHQAHPCTMCKVDIQINSLEHHANLVGLKPT